MVLHPDELTDDLLLQPESRTNNSLISRLASAGHLDRNYIDGEWVLPAAQARSAVIDPSTEDAVAEIALGSAQDVAVAVGVAVAAARRAFAAWSGSSSQSRAALPERVHRLISSERVAKFYVVQEVRA